MELRHLRYFEMVATEMHFGRAASKLNISQPALSKQVKELEDELGLALFLRLKKSVQLTDAGLVFLEETRKTLQQAELAVHRTRLVKAGDYGELRLGYDVSVLASVLTPLLKELKAIHPQLKVSLREGCNRSLTELVKEGGLDVAFVFGTIVFPELSFETISQEGCLVALPASHSLAYCRQVPLEALKEDNFILHPRWESPDKYDQMLQLCQWAGFTPNIVHENASLQARLSLVASGMGVCFAMEPFTKQPHPGIAFVELTDGLPPMPLGIAWKRSKMKPLVRQVLQLVRKQVQENKLVDIAAE